MKEKKYDIVGMSDCCVDCAVTVQKLPTHNQGSRSEVMTFQGGGNVATGLVAAARMGGSEKVGKIGAIGYVGDDAYGHFCIRDFDVHGIDTRYLEPVPGKTTNVAIVLSDRETQGRSIMTNVGTIHEAGIHPVVPELLTDTKWLYTTARIDRFLPHIRMAKEAGAKLFIDAANSASVPYIDQIDAFIASEFCYREMFGNDPDFEGNCRKTFDMGPEIVIFTLGENGLVGFDEEEGFFRIPAYKMDVRCTLGCGDVFHGAYLMLLNLGYGPKEGARIASAVSGIKTTRTGGRAGIPDLPTTLRFMETGEIDYTDIDKRVQLYGRSLAYV